ncbi:MAG TPA: hypothetical protein VGU01_14830 [Sphingomicrobium sp.]|nr:hypothetical protein [Sphingomicrobium sp.]
MSLMPRYYLHLRDEFTDTLEPEGKETPLEAVARTALLAARDCMAGDVRDGRLDLRYRIDVHDERSKLVHSLAFADALVITTE